MPFELTVTKRPAQALRRCIASEVQAAKAELLQKNPDAIHEARKHLKKARSALRLLQGVKPRHPTHELRRALRDVAHRLSQARDLEVVAGWLDEWRKTTPVEAERKLVERLQNRLVSVGRSPSAPPALKSAIADLASIVSRMEALALQDVDWKAIRRNAARSNRRMRNAGKKFHETSDPADLHEWRKRSKDLWYQLRLLRPLLRRSHRKLPHALRQLTEAQGKLHDLDVVRSLLDKPMATLAVQQRGIVESRIAVKSAQMLLKLDQRAKLVHQSLPDDFTDALSGIEG